MQKKFEGRKLLQSWRNLFRCARRFIQSTCWRWTSKTRNEASQHVRASWESQHSTVSNKCDCRYFSGWISWKTKPTARYYFRAFINWIALSDLRENQKSIDKRDANPPIASSPMRLRSNPWHPCCIAETATKTTRDPNRIALVIARKNEIIGINDKERQIKNIKILESPNPIVIRSTKRKNNLRRSLNNKIKNRSNPALDPLLRKLIPWILKQMILYMNDCGFIFLEI